MAKDSEQGASERDEPAEARREALRKIGRFGAYTAPLMVAMLTSSKALAQSGGGGLPGPNID